MRKLLAPISSMPSPTAELQDYFAGLHSWMIQEMDTPRGTLYSSCHGPSTSFTYSTLQPAGLYEYTPCLNVTSRFLLFLWMAPLNNHHGFMALNREPPFWVPPIFFGAVNQ
jgi:hypothetical protein